MMWGLIKRTSHTSFLHWRWMDVLGWEKDAEVPRFSTTIGLHCCPVRCGGGAGLVSISAPFTGWLRCGQSMEYLQLTLPTQEMWGTVSSTPPGGKVEDLI